MSTGAEALPQPEVTPEHLRPHREDLRLLGALLADLGGDLDDEILTLESTWRGDAALSCTLDVATLRTMLVDDVTRCENGRTALATYAETLRTAREEIAGLQRSYDEAVTTLSQENGEIPPQLSRFDREEWRDGNQHRFEEAVAPLRRRHTTAVEEVEAADRTCATALRGLVDALSPESMRGGSTGGEPDVDVGAYQSAAFALNLAATADNDPDADRRAAQLEAFVESVGRPPTTPSEWRTAAMLDPASYLEKNGGVDAGVYVARIIPRPGDGQVRAGWFIPVDEVFNVPHYDLGDDRGFDPDFDPEQTRVAVYIDYELGLVIARNNPTVSTDGEIAVGVPDIQVQEHPDGRVRVFYDAGNPLAPPGSEHTHTVYGDIVLGPDGAAGRISDYPSLEVYHDAPDGTTTPLLNDEADDWGEYADFLEDFGPFTELPFNHAVGDDPMRAINDFYRDDMDGGRHDYEWRNPHLRYPDGYDFTSLGSTDDPPDVSVAGE